MPRYYYHIVIIVGYRTYAQTGYSITYFLAVRRYVLEFSFFNRNSIICEQPMQE